jgi:hypothetical protein
MLAQQIKGASKDAYTTDKRCKQYARQQNKVLTGIFARERKKALFYQCQSNIYLLFNYSSELC